MNFIRSLSLLQKMKNYGHKSFVSGDPHGAQNGNCFSRKKIFTHACSASSIEGSAVVGEEKRTTEKETFYIDRSKIMGKRVLTCYNKRSDDGDERYIHERTPERVFVQEPPKAVAARAGKLQGQHQRSHCVPDSNKHRRGQHQQRCHQRDHEEDNAKGTPQPL